MRQKLVIANWKMSPENAKEAKKLFSQTTRLATKLKKTHVIVSPPSLFISSLVSKVKSKGKISIGAQNALWGSTGASTGEISMAMLKEIGASSVIVGHSERRAMGETDTMVSKKVLSALNESLTPILCIGESIRDEHGEYLAFLANQIKASLASVSKRDLGKIVIAYEPIWAIGKKAEDAMSPHKLHEMVIFIQKALSSLFGREYAQDPRVIYGGSVEAENADNLIRNGNVLGFLVGHASLNAKGFGEILSAVDKA